MSNTIDHPGIIQKIEGNRIFVKIVQQSACTDCHAKGICSASDSKDKIIEITDYSNAYNENDRVMICGKTATGLKAVLLAFVIPLIIVLTTIITGSVLLWDEALSALAGLITLIPYYVILYCFRKQLKKEFVFTLKKLN